jgi:predicted RNase H-like nuclease/superfamily I DNA/RNA helicase
VPEVQIADTFFPSTAALSMVDKGRALDFLTKLLQNPASTGLSLERVTSTADPKVWSARVSQDLRAILHRDADTYIVLFAGRHDRAYGWAATHRVERNARLGSLQIVASTTVFEERLEAIPTPPDAPSLFDAYGDEDLLGLGVPPDWLAALRKITSEDLLLDALTDLPAEAGERLLQLLYGEPVTPPEVTPLDQPALANPDTRRHFFVVEDNAELERMLEAPLAAWLAFLHPSQRRLVEGSFRGPVKVTGSAGTGKTVVGLHRARHLARQGRRVLLTTFSNALCDNLERGLALLCDPAERARITVRTVDSLARSINESAGDPTRPPSEGQIGRLIEQAGRALGAPFPPSFLAAEWHNVIQAQEITTWEEYRTASRTGRGRALSAAERKQVWAVCERVQEGCRHAGIADWPELKRRARLHLEAGRVARGYDAVVVDEVQDLGPQELRLLATVAGEAPDALMLLGDAGQRIYARRFSLRALGIEVRGRAHILRLNYRTTEQIRRFADRLVGELSDDLEGGLESRRGCRSLIRGPEPVARGFATPQAQHDNIASEIARLQLEGRSLDEIAVFARSRSRLDTLKRSLADHGVPALRISQPEGAVGPAVALGTMHAAKGLEFKVVFVADVADGVLPLPAALQGLDDPQDREEALDRERQLLYVSLTRARDEVFLTWAGEPSPFLEEVLTAPVVSSPGQARVESVTTGPEPAPARSDTTSKPPAEAPKELIGIDGCNGGWVLARSDAELQELRFEFASDLAPIFRWAGEGNALVLIDMPIGLPEVGPRACDLEARRLLGAPRNSSVFPPPCRAALAATTYAEAQRLNRSVGGKGLSQQLFGILPKMREVDNLMTPELQEHVREAHPEVTFAVLAATGHGLEYAKKHPDGHAERRELLTRHLPPFDPAAARRSLPPGTATLDDIIDAAACLVTAHRVMAGRAAVLPQGQIERDPKGLRVEMNA